MKLLKNTILSSLAALLFTTSVYANTQNNIELANQVDVEKQIKLQLQGAMSQIKQADIQAELVTQMHKMQVELHTDMLVASANETLPANRFKVVIAE